MKKVELVNAYKGNTVRPIKAQYKNTSYANLIRGDSFGATGVMEVKIKEATVKGYAEIEVGGC